MRLDIAALAALSVAIPACASSKISEDHLDHIPRDAPVEVAVAPGKVADGRGGYMPNYEAQNYLETKLAAVPERFFVNSRVNWSEVTTEKALGYEDFVRMDKETLQELLQGAEYLFVWEETAEQTANQTTGDRMVYSWTLKGMDVGNTRIVLSLDGKEVRKRGFGVGSLSVNEARREAIEGAVARIR